MTTDGGALETRAADGGAFTREEAEQLLASANLITIGTLGESARSRRSGQDVTFGRVAVVPPGARSVDPGDAGEIRLTGTPASVDEACETVRAVAGHAAGCAITGFSAADLLDLAGLDGLSDAAARLSAAGLEAVAECPLDRLGDSSRALSVIQALNHGGLATWRLTVDRAPMASRLALAELAQFLQERTGGIRAFAPLPRIDLIEAPSTGYDDVRSIAMAGLICRDVAWIQVDWPLYGPKLAQVALAFGANDIDGVAARDDLGLGVRRSPREDIMRQIRSAGCQPVERTGRYERRS